MQTVANFLPELMLSAAICLALVLEMIAGKRQPRAVPWFGAIALLLVSWIAVRRAVPGLDIAFAGEVHRADFLTVAVRVVSCLAGILTLVAATGSREMEERGKPGEFAILVLGLVQGAMLFASATNLLSLYVGLEFLSLTGYALAGLRVGSKGASEAGLKYVLFGGIASGLMVFGMSHLFGLTGSLDLASIGQILSVLPSQPILWIPLVLVGAGFAYKLALVPFHFWSPDVYEGCPTVAAAVLTTVPKLAGFAGLWHLLVLVFPAGTCPASDFFVTGIALLSLLTMAVGSLTALSQTDARRILAFSSVTNAGVMLLATVSWQESASLAALLFYLVAYVFANMGAFLALDLLRNDGHGTRLSELSGAWQRHPWIVTALVVCTLSLVGLPPLAGFLAKWNLLRTVLSGAFHTRSALLTVASLVVLGSSVVLAFSYLRIVRACAVAETSIALEENDYEPSGEAPWALLLCTAFTVALGFGWPLIEIFQRWIAP
jgi:NADH-quinone oxidoreductase subunit N